MSDLGSTAYVTENERVNRWPDRQIGVAAMCGGAKCAVEGLGSKDRWKKPLQEPVLPAVITTPADPWPRPYYFEGGFRRVRPYYFTYTTWCKERWRGRELIDIFESEFRDRPLAYYRNAMEGGEVAVNSKTVGPHYVLRNGDYITHTLHRHEPPVTIDPIGVLHEDDHMIVLNKPSGVPVHPSGRYNFNSITEIMKSERGPSWTAYPCNRLDRLTSGIMFVAKNPKAAVALGNQIADRTVNKEYIARVIGRFPDGEVVCNQPILAISPKLGLNRVRANGKHARTVFQRLAYYPPTKKYDREPTSEGNADSPADAASGAGRRPWSGKEGYSIVRCMPVTGRTHQLRVHLQFLGHPIQNDPIYANQKVWGFDLGSHDSDASLNSDEDIISRLSRMGKEDVATAVAYYDEMVDEYEKRRAEKMSGEVCDMCQTPLYTDPGPHELSLWLHSLRYEDKHGKWGYVSPLPAWALPPKGFNGPTQVGDMGALVEAAVKEADPE
ncbi:pseudouridine synthase [Coniella lustricola]|uniref:Pseudouridine synthase n=1 Tax=Coniella lustricola TaxID=2025994 RepID=A0A2T3AI04_9PEZI|nr:pseudouridine synthase [Coniella lustricola]